MAIWSLIIDCVLHPSRMSFIPKMPLFAPNARLLQNEKNSNERQKVYLFGYLDRDVTIV